MGTDASTGVFAQLEGRMRSIQLLTAGLVAAHFVLGIATEFTGNRLLRVASLAAAGLAFLAVLVGIVALLRA